MKHIMQQPSAAHISTSAYGRGAFFRGMREGNGASAADLALEAGLPESIVRSIEADGGASSNERELYFDGLARLMAAERQRVQELRRTNPRAFWCRVDETLAAFDRLYGPIAAV